MKAVHRLRHSGHEVIRFHILDEAEALFPFDGVVELEDNETGEALTVDALGVRDDYLAAVAAFQSDYKRDFFRARVDYVPLHTGMAFDKALMGYLLSRQRKG